MADTATYGSKAAIDAANIHDAVDIARRLREQGKYQYFRGQENSAWKPLPSFHRLAPSEKPAALDRADLFVKYTREIAAQSRIRYSDDELLAIAQHYGIATTFLDLTTDPVVAAHFACPPESRHASSKAAILLYSESQIEALSNAHEQIYGVRTLELIRLDVSNLWRLESQRGLFLHMALTDKDLGLAVARIEFPHPADGFLSPQYDIYPKEKSPLEIQLDLFFSLEDVEKRKQELLGLVHVVVFKPSADALPGATPRLEAVRAGISMDWVKEEVALHQRLADNFHPIDNVPLRALSDTGFPSRWKYRSGILWPHSSWFGADANSWLEAPVEDYQLLDRSGPFDIDLHLDQYDGDPWSVNGSTARKFPVGSLNRSRSLRFHVVDPPWASLSTLPGNDGWIELEEEVERIAQVLWDGLRSKPLADDHIAGTVDRYLRLVWAFANSRIDGSRDLTDAAFGRQGIDHVKVEFTPLGGHSRLLKVRCAALQACLRQDFAEQIEQLEPSTDGSFSHLEQLVYPQYLFGFNEFAAMYFQEMLPYHAFLQTITAAKQHDLAFNPRQIKVFGLY